jgi:hypothetical protein
MINSNSRFPAGMTKRKTKAKAKATTKAGAQPVWRCEFEMRVSRCGFLGYQLSAMSSEL